MSYRVVLRKSAEKELARLPNEAILSIVATLRALEIEPRPPGCKAEGLSEFMARKSREL